MRPFQPARVGLWLTASWALLQAVRQSEARCWAQPKGFDEGGALQSPVAGSGNLRSLLQASPERHSHSHINAALTSDEVHAAAWRMADEVRHGRHIVDSELRTVVDTFARMLSSSDHYAGDAALFLDEVDHWPVQNYQSGLPIRHMPAAITTNFEAGAGSFKLAVIGHLSLAQKVQGKQTTVRIHLGKGTHAAHDRVIGMIGITEEASGAR